MSIYVCFRLRMHQVVAETIHLSIGYSKQTVGGFSRQKKILKPYIQINKCTLHIIKKGST
ncbi:hypothetical protein PMEGAPR236_55350 [Priestia megaterium]